MEFKIYLNNQYNIFRYNYVIKRLNIYVVRIIFKSISTYEYVAYNVTYSSSTFVDRHARGGSGCGRGAGGGSDGGSEWLL